MYHVQRPSATITRRGGMRGEQRRQRRAKIVSGRWLGEKAVFSKGGHGTEWGRQDQMKCWQSPRGAVSTGLGMPWRSVTAVWQVQGTELQSAPGGRHDGPSGSHDARRPVPRQLSHLHPPLPRHTGQGVQPPSLQYRTSPTVMAPAGGAACG